MSSTTLMTFLLTTSPNVKSVKLLGSWDNFSKPYAMERDRRVGPGHWRGCHTFTDIVCDGTPTHQAPARSGGLKMGGTYWYYYLLDNDVEYYNEAEPVTSLCPLLPGQPLNVLQVPVILPDTRPTHTFQDSPSSRKADVRTMNPEDKYMNPRRPPKPKLPRLRTSPPLLQAPTPAWSFNTSPLGALTNRATSQPSSSVNKTPRSSSSKAARSVSPPRSRGLRAAVRYLNASSPDLSNTHHSDGELDSKVEDPSGVCRTGSSGKGRFDFPEQSGHDFNTASTVKHYEHSLHPEDFLFRRPVSADHETPLTMSIQDRRALNTKSMEHLSCRSPLTLETQPDNTSASEKCSSKTFSYMAAELLAALESPSFLRTAPIPDATTPTPFTYKEKRLPTLPNSPSSVMDEALRDIDARERELDTENLGSRFSDFTETEGSVVGSSYCERSHFSEWSTDTEIISPESMTSSSTFNNENQLSRNPGDAEFSDQLVPSLASDTSDPNTPHLTVNSKSSPATSTAGDSPHFNLPLPRLTVSLSPSDLDMAGLGIEDMYNVERDPKRHAAFFGAMDAFETLGLVKTPDASTTEFSGDVKNSTASLTDNRDISNRLSRASTSMLDMMDELAYLRNVIQSGTGEE
ncbi:hypothetical protein IFM58399_06487 [Aspergillus lentulus]|uniref:Uncharacterized protein n=1 Tax=Aspergillus lentulus TaxID=293939 RepID=A0AAN6BK88_ASPLE|nr:uncharacterized protein IFM58399_06487 [Aspergillus lentulus]KAF4200411.1 hypothetical protein CNMCM8927_003420 [Aspergillus lentulus]GFF42086.1 hypothetical protein IFM58399_06487 [Aspergillus lentulus]GFF88441.1 hypothetical protein IFM47457_07813 [Aspergillus lentulus]GFF89207.1 hypothetical protein IFM60648_08650 [Aspergillus lentulus]